MPLHVVARPAAPHVRSQASNRQACARATPSPSGTVAPFASLPAWTSAARHNTPTWTRTRAPHVPPLSATPASLKRRTRVCAPPAHSCKRATGACHCTGPPCATCVSQSAARLKARGVQATGSASRHCTPAARARSQNATVVRHASSARAALPCPAGGARPRPATARATACASTRASTTHPPDVGKTHSRPGACCGPRSESAPPPPPRPPTRLHPSTRLAACGWRHSVSNAAAHAVCPPASRSRAASHQPTPTARTRAASHSLGGCPTEVRCHKSALPGSRLRAPTTNSRHSCARLRRIAARVAASGPPGSAHARRAALCTWARATRSISRAMRRRLSVVRRATSKACAYSTAPSSSPRLLYAKSIRNLRRSQRTNCGAKDEVMCHVAASCTSGGMTRE